VARGRQVPRRDCFGAPPAGAPPIPSKSGSRMINPFQFMQEVRSEAGKITWPTRRETLVTSGLVILMVLFASLFFVLVDWTLRFSVKLLLHIGQ
jgi:preprotein translocase subunit SecE